MDTEDILQFRGVRTGPPAGHGLWFESLGKVTTSLYPQTRALLNLLFPLEAGSGRHHARRRDPYKSGATMTAVVHGQDARATI